MWVFAMRDMRCANNGSYSLSKGTQSDGLISDTSTEELSSSSSTENLKEGKTFEKVVAKETKELHNESHDSTNSIHSCPSISLHQIQTRCRLYIRWSVLLSFGIVLWIALSITDIYNPNPFLKAGWLLDVATAKRVTQTAGTAKKAAPFTWRIFELWSYAWNSIISVTTLEIIMFLCFVMILVYLDARARGGSTGRLCYDQLYKRLRNNGAEQSETDDNTLRLNSLKEESELKEPGIESRDDDLSKFSHGDVRNLMTQRVDNVNSELAESGMQCLNKGEASSIENRIFKSLKGSRNINNHRKRSLQSNSGKNYCNFSCRGNSLSREVVTSEQIFNRPSFDSSHVSPTPRSDQTESILEQSNLRCSVFNQSTSFMSEKIETWFELPNSDQAEGAMHSFDAELDKYSEIQHSPSPLSSEETSQTWHPFNDNNIGCESREESKALISKVNYNRGIVSSSPAFRRFLVNLARDKISEPNF